MRFGLALSLVIVGFAVVGVFVFIPFVSAYAFWIVIAAYSSSFRAEEIGTRTRSSGWLFAVHL